MVYGEPKLTRSSRALRLAGLLGHRSDGGRWLWRELGVGAREAFGPPEGTKVLGLWRRLAIHHALSFFKPFPSERQLSDLSIVGIWEHGSIVANPLKPFDLRFRCQVLFAVWEH